jgi:hypothetical protein
VVERRRQKRLAQIRALPHASRARRRALARYGIFPTRSHGGRKSPGSGRNPRGSEPGNSGAPSLQNPLPAPPVPLYRQMKRLHKQQPLLLCEHD